MYTLARLLPATDETNWPTLRDPARMRDVIIYAPLIYSNWMSVDRRSGCQTLTTIGWAVDVVRDSAQRGWRQLQYDE